MIRNNLLLVSLVASGALAGLGLAATVAGGPVELPALESARNTLDRSLADRVENRLKTEMGLAGARISVASSAGVITLSGLVPENFARERAMQVAADVRGVREVRSELETGHPN